MKSYNTIVIGLGAMGSSTLYQLAKKGNRILGIDQFNPPHAHGSSHGDTRITRLAIGEGKEYVPLVKRSHEIWREMEDETGEKLMNLCGGLIISSKAKSTINHVEHFFENTIHAARKFDIAHEILEPSDVRRRFPQFNIQNNEKAYYEKDAGYLFPEKCVAAQLQLARKYGADIHTGEKVLSYASESGGETVVTDKGTYFAEQIVITAGPWVTELLGDSKVSENFEIYRQVLYWFDVNESDVSFTPNDCPIFIWELQGDKQGIYGFPAVDGKEGGVKIASEQFSVIANPDSVNREVTQKEMSTFYREYVEPYIKGVTGDCLRAVTCLYTVTPDFGFVIDRHPEKENVIVVSPCSGHGFKHSAAIGEAVSEMIIDGETNFDLSTFKFSRFK